VSNNLVADPRALKRNEWNSNHVSPENEHKLDEAIKRFGFFKPIIVREVPGGFEILGGEHRAASAERLGLTEVPIFNLGPISDKEAKEISLADNARYGSDDALQLAAILEDIGDAEDIQSYLPYTESDLTSIFASTNIALDDLDLDDLEPGKEETPEPAATKTPKTHTVMRFKVAIADAERVTETIAKVQKRHGYTAADDLTNAGDALVHLLFAAQTDGEDD
jgi:ParB-like chromosome segregation protein Spo0J